MTREILFGGKRLDNGEWVEGFYVRLYDGKGNVSHRIYTGCAESDCGYFYPENFEVDPSTVGQFTGLTANGKKIFEGDIVRRTDYRHNRGYEVAWNDLLAGYWYVRNDTFYSVLTEGCEIIGNKWDNPELLEDEG